MKNEKHPTDEYISRTPEVEYESVFVKNRMMSIVKSHVTGCFLNLNERNVMTMVNSVRYIEAMIIFDKPVKEEFKS